MTESRDVELALEALTCLEPEDLLEIIRRAEIYHDDAALPWAAVYAAVGHLASAALEIQRTSAQAE